jgi:hypothetical protein
VSGAGDKGVESVDLGHLLTAFFTAGVSLPTCPADLAPRTLWWEERDGWLYPWRILGYEAGVAQGYPCGEPKRGES